MTVPTDTLGQLIRSRRESLGMTQATLATRIGCPREYVSQIETSNRIWPKSYVAGLSNALGVPLESLYAAAGRTRPNAALVEITHTPTSTKRLLLSQLEGTVEHLQREIGVLRTQIALEEMPPADMDRGAA